MTCIASDKKIPSEDNPKTEAEKMLFKEPPNYAPPYRY